jgi:hypothetical protein
MPMVFFSAQPASARHPDGMDGVSDGAEQVVLVHHFKVRLLRMRTMLTAERVSTVKPQHQPACHLLGVRSLYCVLTGGETAVAPCLDA